MSNPSTTNPIEKNKTAYILLFLAPILWGSSFIAAKIMIGTTHFLIMQGFRHVIALLGFLPFVKSFKNIDKSTFLVALITGGCNAAAMLVQTIGLQTTTASKCGFITALYVVFVPIFSFVFYRKKISKSVIIAVMIAVLGMFILSFDTTNPESFLSFTFGDFLILLCALFFGLQMIFTERFVGKVKDLKMFSFLQIFVVATICFSLTLFDLSVYQIPDLSTGYWLAWIYMGIGCTTLPFFFLNYGQKYIEATKVSLIISIEPIWGMVFGILIADEPLTVEFIIGAIMILGASIFAIKRSQT
jgi:drug/metabolite transporter (DMT)-like permease